MGSSFLHADVSRIIETHLGIDIRNRVSSGPLSLDICHFPSMVVVEPAESWQFYLRSIHSTALARRRHELIRAMGFRLAQVPCYDWDTLQDDSEKISYLRKHLPAELLSHSRGPTLSTESL